MTCAPSFFPGAWDAVAVPADTFFCRPELRQAVPLLVYGPAHLFRSAWLTGCRDYLRDPWHPEELFLRLRGPQPPFVEWTWSGHNLRLEGLVVSRKGGASAVLSTTEADLLRMLVQRRGLAVSRPVLAWAASCSPGRVIDTLVARVRRKIQGLADSPEDPLPGVRGLGYRIP